MVQRHLNIQNLLSFFFANLKYTKLSFKLILIWRRFCQINPRAKGEFPVTKKNYELQIQNNLVIS